MGINKIDTDVSEIVPLALIFKIMFQKGYP